MYHFHMHYKPLIYKSCRYPSNCGLSTPPRTSNHEWWWSCFSGESVMQRLLRRYANCSSVKLSFIAASCSFFRSVSLDGWWLALERDLPAEAAIIGGSQALKNLPIPSNRNKMDIMITLYIYNIKYNIRIYIYDMYIPPSQFHHLIGKGRLSFR